MQSVQRALSGIGIPVYATAWRRTPLNPTAPDTYCVYTSMRVEDEHFDDVAKRYKVYIYLNLWTKDDPTSMIATIRAAMRAGGFELDDERDSYNDDIDQFLIAWTWVGWEEVDA